MNHPAPTLPGRPHAVVRPMLPRSAHEHHRVSTPLELFFDLVFVVAIAFAGAQLHHAISANHAAQGALGFVLVFFAIWWAWMGFTWFASAFDNDDVPYRIAVWVQMGGALVMAAGVVAAFEHQDWRTVTLGYVLMRLALVAQWLRAAAQSGTHRATCRRYALGVSLVQLGWIAQLWVPPPWGLLSFGVLVLCEMAVPVWAERAGATPWHPHHIAERYGLMTIIVLGESVLAAATAIQKAVAQHLWSAELVLFCVGALLIMFCMWWMYFEDEVADHLTDLRTAFFWGYGHLVVFAAAAATGAGLAVQVDLMMGGTELAPAMAALGLALPVALYCLAVWFVHKCRGDRRGGHRVHPVAALLVLATPWLPGHPTLLMGVVLMGAVAVNQVKRTREAL